MGHKTKKMKAEEARSLAKKKNTTGSQYNEIMSMIRGAALKGEYEIWYYNHSILPDVRDALTAEGYKVGDTINDRNDLMTKISWQS